MIYIKFQILIYLSLLYLLTPIKCFSFTILQQVGAFSGVTIGIIGYFKEAITDWTYNKFICPIEDLDLKIKDLSKAFIKIYGQKNSLETLMGYIEMWARDIKNDRYPSKAIGISIQGPPGVGKTYTMQKIESILFGEKSIHFHNFGHLNFLRERNENEMYVYNYIKSSVSKCKHNIFFFDDVHLYPKGFLDVLKPFLDNRPDIGGIDYRLSFFVFVSNDNNIVLNMATDNWNKGLNKFYESKAFRRKLVDSLLHSGGGFDNSQLIISNLIDDYINFLPLEENDVRTAMHDLMHQKNITKNEKLVDKIINNLNFIPDELQIYSESGCRSIENLLIKYNEKYKY
ncbi:Torsin family 2 member A [Intoshia linei]|uniref:Torsin family 2 member A n=1 Tax=Intoshia linei TaxID=1819745 RepID=A0A177AQ87_9BILA|nr:Torsin family 2 member A [Intoshia linei]